MKARQTGKGRKKGQTILLIFIMYRPLWRGKSARLRSVRYQSFSLVFINPDIN